MNDGSRSHLPHPTSKTMKQFLIIALALTMGLASMATAAPALAQTAAKPLALRGIMQELDRHMQAITLAISRKDWALVEKTAPLIAEHREPPFMEKARIMAFIGTDVARFKRHDTQTHEAALAMGLAARNKDGQAVAASFQALENRCAGCHTEFRKPFVAHFYKTN